MCVCVCDVTSGVLAHGRPWDSLSSELTTILLLLFIPTINFFLLPAVRQYSSCYAERDVHYNRPTGAAFTPTTRRRRRRPRRSRATDPRRSAAVSAGPEILTVRSGSRLLCALIVRTVTASCTTPPGTTLLEHVVEMRPDIGLVVRIIR